MTSKNRSMTVQDWINGYARDEMAERLVSKDAEIERLTADRDKWARKAHDWRAKYAELRYPGMKGLVHPADEMPG